MATPVDDLRDTRVLIPRVRRAVLGPHAVSSAGSELNDEEVNNLVADAIADIILYTGGSSVFGHQLEVVERDAFYMAPVAWQTDTELTLPEQSVVVAQAALNYFFHVVKDVKVSEAIGDEAQSWSYSLSATVIRDQIDMLRQARDRALEQVAAQHPIAEAYISFIKERDSLTSALIEPWVDGVSTGGQLLDPRGFA